MKNKNHNVMDDVRTQPDILANIRFGRRRRFSLRMAPLIDMIFLLLIFFLVAAKWRPQEDFLPFSLPAARAQQAIAAPEPLIIHISAAQTGCQVKLGEHRTIQIDNKNPEQSLVLLTDGLRSCLISQKRFTSDPVEIVCGPQVKWDYVAKIYSCFLEAGLTDITFRMTEQ